MALLNLNHVTQMLIINGRYLLFLSHPQCIYQLLNITHWPLLTSSPSSISGQFSESGKVKPARWDKNQGKNNHQWQFSELGNGNRTRMKARIITSGRSSKSTNRSNKASRRLLAGCSEIQETPSAPSHLPKPVKKKFRLITTLILLIIIHLIIIKWPNIMMRCLCYVLVTGLV